MSDEWGDYPDVAQVVLDVTDAQAVVVIVIGGSNGTGYSVLGSLPDGAAMAVAALAETLDSAS